MKKVGIWIRVSTEEQKKGESPKHHRIRAEKFAEFKKWDVVEVYDLAGVSGKSVIEHPECRRMLHDIQEGRISGLIFSKLARLGRNSKELLEFADFFQKHDSDLISLDEAIDTTTPAGKLFFTMIAAMAQFEREEISSRIKASVKVRADLGKPLGGKPPYGYDIVDGQFVLNEKEVPVRKLMFELYLEYRGIKTVATELNKRGYRTRTGGLWRDNSVRRLLTDPIAKGLRRSNYSRSLGNNKHWEYKPKENWVFHPAPAIVANETWDAVNNIIEERYKKNMPYNAGIPKHLFAGFLYCGPCNVKMYAVSGTKKYICKKCRAKIPKDDLEEIFHTEFPNLIPPEKIKEHLKNQESKLQTKKNLVIKLKNDAIEVHKKMENLLELVTLGEIPKRGFKKLYKPLEQLEEQIKTETATLSGEIDTFHIDIKDAETALHEIVYSFENWVSHPKDEKRKIVESVLHSIVLDGDDIIIRPSYSPTSSQTNPFNLESIENPRHNHKDSCLPPT